MEAGRFLVRLVTLPTSTILHVEKYVCIQIGYSAQEEITYTGRYRDLHAEYFAVLLACHPATTIERMAAEIAVFKNHRQREVEVLC